MMKKRDEHKVAADERNIFLRKKSIQHQVQYHVLNMKKVIFLRKKATKHEQNVVKSGVNIIPARNVKMR